MIDPDIASYYLIGTEERRLFDSEGRPRIEYLRTLELLDRFLPPAPGRILDVGGATGVYAVPLVERGYTVQVVDPMPLHVQRAQTIALERKFDRMSASVGDARDLSPFGGEHNAVLLLGPLYHLTEATDRARAFREAVRATRPGGVVVGVGISRFASLFDGLKRRLLHDETFRPIVEQDLVDGQHRNAALNEHLDMFTTAYFHLPGELEAEAIAAGLIDVRLFAVEGAAWVFEDTASIENQLFAARATESEPALLAATSHIMVVGSVAA
jgi:SAM-dependent methyltransferase